MHTPHYTGRTQPLGSVAVAASPARADDIAYHAVTIVAILLVLGSVLLL